jgi:hypothetical protein
VMNSLLLPLFCDCQLWRLDSIQFLVGVPKLDSSYPTSIPYY